MIIPAPFKNKVAADTALMRLKSGTVIPMAAYLAAADEQRKARRSCEIYFKPPKGSNA